MAAEIEVGRLLAALTEELIPRIGELDDAEARASFYRLVGMCTVDTTQAIAFFRQMYESEETPLARGCAAEGLVVAMMRSSKLDEFDVKFLRTIAATDELAANRITNAPFDLVGDGESANVQRVEDLIGRSLSRQKLMSWPSELL